MLRSLIILMAILVMSAAYKILVVVPVPSKSHVILFENLVMELGARGHQVTYVSAHKLPKQSPNVREIVVPIQIFGPDGKPLDFLKVRTQTPLHNILKFPEIGIATTEQLLNNPKFQEFLKEKPKFDILLQEAFVSEGLMAGLARYFNVPFIGYGTFMPSSWTNYMVGNEAPSSYIPEPFLGHPYGMNFYQRLTNFLYARTSELHHKLSYLPRQDALMRKYFGNDHPYVEEIIRNMSALFINDHVSTSFPRPWVQNMIGIAGVHVLKPKPLPTDLQNYLDNSKKGAIFFSLGSNIRAALMSKDKMRMFLNTFAKLEQNIIWKFEEEITDLPKNVMISKWLPQSDILAHPNIKLFITHGGLLSTTEAIDRGVPVVGIPVFGDQPTNMAMSVRAGVGLSLEFDKLTEENLLQTIKEVLNNPKYTVASKQRSLRYHDRVTSAMDLAIWWIEYVIRHEGAHHLRSAVHDLTWYEAAQLDVVAVLLAALFIVFYAIKKILKALWSLITGGNTKNKKSKKEKKRN